MHNTSRGAIFFDVPTMTRTPIKRENAHKSWSHQSGRSQFVKKSQCDKHSFLEYIRYSLTLAFTRSRGKGNFYLCQKWARCSTFAPRGCRGLSGYRAVSRPFFVTGPFIVREAWHGFGFSGTRYVSTCCDTPGSNTSAAFQDARRCYAPRRNWSRIEPWSTRTRRRASSALIARMSPKQEVN